MGVSIEQVIPLLLSYVIPLSFLLQTVWAIMMIVFGFGLIYVVPFAFRYQYWGLFLGLVNATLLGMVLGLATVASILQGKIEKLMLHVLMWRGARRWNSLPSSNPPP